MHLTNPCQSYRSVATQTASPGQLVLMLYDGAIRFLNLAQEGFTKDDPLEFNLTINNNVIKAQAVIQELNETLDMESGGELAKTLRSLYTYMDGRLHESNRLKNDEGILDVVDRLNQLRNAWSEMLQQGTSTSGGRVAMGLSAAA